MRRSALFGLLLLLPGCQSYVGSPLVGADDFIGDTHTFHLNPNAPVDAMAPPDAANLERVRGLEPTVEPVLADEGNIWPGPPAPMPTLADLEKAQMEEQGSPNAAPAITMPRGEPSPSTSPADDNDKPYTVKKGGGILIPNGDGTSTLVAPDGTVSTVPTPK